LIAVDTSALMAILLDEREAEGCATVLEQEDDILISAGTLAESLIVAARRNVGSELRVLVHGLGMQCVPVTKHMAERVAAAYDRWGKGVHPSGLNFGDCFAYALAQERACKLLFVGEDFRMTDVDSAGPSE